MVTKKLTQQQQKDYLKLLHSNKETGVYQKAVGKAIFSSPIQANQDVILMDLSDSFFAVFRQTGEEEYFLIGKALRRAAHTVHRELRRQNKNKPINARFLHIISA